MSPARTPSKAAATTRRVLFVLFLDCFSRWACRRYVTASMRSHRCASFFESPLPGSRNTLAGVASVSVRSTDQAHCQSNRCDPKVDQECSICRNTSRPISASSPCHPTMILSPTRRTFSGVTDSPMTTSRPRIRVSSLFEPTHRRTTSFEKQRKTPLHRRWVAYLTPYSQKASRNLGKVIVFVIVACICLWTLCIDPVEVESLPSSLESADEEWLYSPPKNAPEWTSSEVITPTSSARKQNHPERIRRPPAPTCTYDPDFPYGVELGFVKGWSFTGNDAWDGSEVRQALSFLIL